jgi:polyisoprenoid-binding protein YceI
MKRFSLLALALCLAFGASTASAQLSAGGGQKTVTLNDKIQKNQFTWVSEAPLENIKGSSEGVSGSFTIDPKNLAGIRGTISTQVKTMKTGNETRDGHLQNASWLDAGKYPVITFKIENVSDVKANGNKASAKATGDFTLHGVTKKMTIPVEITYMPESEATKKRASGDLVMIKADFTVGLKDFNVAGAQGIVGSKVGETIKISAQLYGNTQ